MTVLARICIPANIARPSWHNLPTAMSVSSDLDLERCAQLRLLRSDDPRAAQAVVPGQAIGIEKHPEVAEAGRQQGEKRGCEAQQDIAPAQMAAVATQDTDSPREHTERLTRSRPAESEVGNDEPQEQGAIQIFEPTNTSTSDSSKSL